MAQVELSIEEASLVANSLAKISALDQAAGLAQGIALKLTKAFPNTPAEAPEPEQAKE